MRHYIKLGNSVSSANTDKTFYDSQRSLQEAIGVLQVYMVEPMPRIPLCFIQAA